MRRRYGSIPTTFWPDDMGALIKGNPLAIAMVAYLMSSPHSNMIGIYRLPLEYIHYDTGFSEASIREAFEILRKSEFAYYDESTKTVYIPSYAATQVAPALSPKDNRVHAMQRELDQIVHIEFKKQFLDRYGKIFHLSPLKAPSEGSGGASKGSEGPLKALDDGVSVEKVVDKQGASKGLRRGLVPVPDTAIALCFDSEEGVKRGLGREEGTKPPSKTRQFFESWPEHMSTLARKTH
jgi:hypothetical protein